MITNEVGGTREIKSRIAMAKAAFTKKRAVFSSRLGSDLLKTPVKCYIWTIALQCAENVTLRRVDKKYLKCGAGQR
jgi:hypothetical protein